MMTLSHSCTIKCRQLSVSAFEKRGKYASSHPALFQSRPEIYKAGINLSLLYDNILHRGSRGDEGEGGEEMEREGRGREGKGGEGRGERRGRMGCVRVKVYSSTVYRYFEG